MTQTGDSEVDLELRHALDTLKLVQDNTVGKRPELIDFFLDATTSLRCIPLDGHFEAGYAVGTICGIAAALGENVENLLAIEED